MGPRAIPVLRTGDVEASLEWYERLGFTEVWRHRFGDGYPWFVSVARDDVELYLSEHDGDAVPDTLVWLRLDRFADVVDASDVAPEDQPWGPELRLTDPDGNRLRIGPA